jgi:hypothetical protein
MNTEFLSLITMGKKLAQQAHNGHEMDKPFALSCLLHIESILDKGRTFLDMDDKEGKQEVVKGMEEIRSLIHSILEKMDKEEAKKFLQDNAKTYTTRIVYLVK